MLGNFKKSKKETPAISTSSLPDIVFMLLFFFMVATRMRETEVKVKQSLPKATEMEKLEKKDLLSYIFIGAPTAEYLDEWGTAPRLQLNDQLATPDDVQSFVASEKAKMRPELQAKIIICIKCDKEADLGVLTEVKTELRKANALKLTYITNKGTDPKR
ncbi:MAG: biopolymer transport protein ExbD [Limisphaerales bacterium]|jgi:biopolymer transport protein ExbD